MKIRACSLIFCCLWGLTLHLYGQDENLPEGYGLNIETRENLSAGVLNINLPVESALIPISVSYTTSGMRVNQRPGVVGLGWNLSVGGVITRQKRGLDDDHVHGFSGENQRGNNDPSVSVDVMEKMTSGGWDLEPDIYNYQFLGEGGSFTINHNRQAVKLTANTHKITPRFNVSGFYEFEIVDGQGNIYLFSTIEKLKVELDGVEEENYKYKWHLTSITDYMTKKVTNFTYVTAPSYSEITPRNERTYDWGTTNNVTTDSKDVETIFTPKHLEKISFENSEIVLEYGSRTDLPLYQKLQKISYLRDDVRQVYYNFSYKYLGGTGASRLMLAQVTKSTLDIPLFQFVYFGENSGEYTLPAYNSSQQDHWGYHNANSDPSLFEVLGASRVPNLARTQANSLKKLIHTSGAFEEYEYQLNTFNDGLIGSSDETAGGLRIYKVYRDDGDGTRYTMKTYDYSKPSGGTSGEVYNEPEYIRKFSNASNTKGIHAEYSWRPLRDYNGRHIAYEYVTVLPLEGGKVRTKFRDFTTGATGTLGREVKAFETSGSNSWLTPVYTTLSGYEGPFGHGGVQGDGVGLPEEVTVFDGSGSPLSQEIYTYTKKAATSSVKGWSYINTAVGSGQRKEHLIDSYILDNSFLYTSKLQSVTYDRNNFGRFRRQITDYTYGTAYPLPTVEETYLDNQTTAKLKKTIEYLFENSGNSNVVGHNLIGLVKENASWVGATQLSKTVSDYENGNNTVRLKNNKQYIKGNLVSDTNFDYDDENRRNYSDDLLGGREETLVFDDYNRIIARVKNSVADKVAFSSFEKADKGGWTMPDLKSNAECTAVYNSCVSACNGNQTCINACASNLSTCSTTVNQGTGRGGKHAFDLSKGNISKSIISGDYYVSYWHKSGSVSLSGVSSPVQVETEVRNGWTFRKFKFTQGSSATLTVSGTGLIDDLRLFPQGSWMTSSAYHEVFGVLSKEDANNKLVKYDFDAAGRREALRDESNSILTAFEYHIAPFLDLNKTSLSFSYGAATEEIFVTANKHWAVYGLPAWASQSRVHNALVDQLRITVSANPSTSQRSATITINAGGINKDVTLTQAGIPPAYFFADGGNQIDMTTETEVTVTVNTNRAWSVDMISGPFTVSPTAGTGATSGSSFTITITKDGGIQQEPSPDGSKMPNGVVQFLYDGNKYYNLNITY